MEPKNQSPTTRSAFARRAVVLVALIAAALGLTVWAMTARTLPDVTFQSVAGQPIGSSELRGKVTLIDFWATTCAVCAEEMPDLVRAYTDYHGRGFELVAVAMPYDRPDWVLDYSRKHRLPFHVAIDHDGNVNRAFGGIEGTPTRFLISREGKVIERIVGAIDPVRLRGMIEKELLKK
jgi:peroxiredoxin